MASNPIQLPKMIPPRGIRGIVFNYRLNDEYVKMSGCVPVNDDTEPYKNFDTPDCPTHDFISLPRPFQEYLFKDHLKVKQYFIDREDFGKVDGICQTMFAQMNGEASITEDLKVEYLLTYG